MQQDYAPGTEALLLHACHDAGQSPLLLVLLQLLGMQQLPMLPQCLIDCVQLPAGAGTVLISWPMVPILTFSLGKSHQTETRGHATLTCC